MCIVAFCQKKQPGTIFTWFVRSIVVAHAHLIYLRSCLPQLDIIQAIKEFFPTGGPAADVIKKDIKTGEAILHIIGGVLIPTSKVRWAFLKKPSCLFCYEKPCAIEAYCQSQFHLLVASAYVTCAKPINGLRKLRMIEWK